MFKLVNSNKGLTLIEVLVVVVIFGIIAGIAIPSVLGIIEQAKSGVCEANRLQLGRMYETHLVLSNKVHSDLNFQSYLLDYGEELCPDGGDYSYSEGKVNCSVHSEVGDSEEEKTPGVPFF